MAKTQGRGGKREGAGRPPTGTAQKTRHTVTLDADTLEALKAISDNLSEAIRLLVQASRE